MAHRMQERSEPKYLTVELFDLCGKQIGTGTASLRSGTDTDAHLTPDVD
jgi:hypothetical protein